MNDMLDLHHNDDCDDGAGLEELVSSLNYGQGRVFEHIYNTRHCTKLIGAVAQTSNHCTCLSAVSELPVSLSW